MSVVPLSASLLAGLTEAASANNDTQGNKQDFLALLNLTSGSGNNTTPTGSKQGGVADLLTGDPVKQAMPVGVKNTRGNQPPDPSPAPAQRNASPALVRVTAAKAQTPAQPAPARDSNDRVRDSKAPVGSNASDRPADGKPAARIANANDNTQADASAEPLATAPAEDTSAVDSELADKELRQALEDQLAHINQLLLSIIQALSGGVVTAGGAQAPAIEASAAAAPDAVKAVPAVTDAPSAAPAGLALLKDIRLLVQQLQQSLHDNDAAQAVATPLAQMEPSTAEMPAPIAAASDDKLQEMLAKLSRLTSSLNDDSGRLAQDMAASKPVASTVPAAASFSDDVISLVKSGIADVRNQLQKLKNANEEVFAQAKSSAPHISLMDQFAETKQLFKDTATDTTPALQQQAAAPAAAVLAAAAATPQELMVATSSDASALMAVAITQAQTDSNNADTNSGGNNQGQPLAQAVPSTSSQQSQAGAGAQGANFARLLSQQAPSPLLDQVAFQVKTAVHDGSSKINIQLHPADLGKLDIKLSVDASGKTEVVVTVDNAKTLDMLQRDSQGLAKALSDAGLKTDSGSLSFNLSSGGQQNFNQGAQSDGSVHSALNYQKIQPDDEQDVNLTVLTRSYVVNVAEGVDIEI